MSNDRKLALFTFVDALGYRVLKHHSFLDDVLRTKRPLGTIFGYSSTCDPTIVTRRLPRDHDHFSFFAYNPAKSPFALCRFLALLPDTLTRRGRVRRLLSRSIRRWYGYTGYFQIYNMPFRLLPLFEYTEKRDLYQPGGINAGLPTVFDELRERQIPFSLSDWRLSEERNLAALKADLRQGDTRFAYLYLANLDAVLHEHGALSQEGGQKIAWYDRQLREVLDLAHRHYDTVNLYLFSDHGMTDCHTDCALIPRIEALGLRFGQDYAAVYDSTMARFWFLTERAEPAIRTALAQEPLGDILDQETLRDWGCDFPTNRYGDLFFLMQPGVLLCPSFMGRTHLAGMHGYDPLHEDSVASWSSNLVLADSPARLENIRAVMAGELA